MPITYLPNGQPFEACWRCGGSGSVMGPTEYDDYTGQYRSSSHTCGGCNGTGNELFMCPPEPEHAKKEENHG